MEAYVKVCYLNAYLKTIKPYNAVNLVELVMLIIIIIDLLAIAKDLDSKYCNPDLVDDLIQRKV